MSNILFLIVLGLFLIVLWLQKRLPLLQYLFFCRVPLICGLLLVTLPLIAHFLVPSLLGNLLLVESGRASVFWVTFVTSCAGYMVVQTTELILQQAPERMYVAPLLKLPKSKRKKNAARSNRTRIAAILLALPMGIGMAWVSWDPLGWQGPLLAVLGYLFSFGFFLGVAKFSHSLARWIFQRLFFRKILRKTKKKLLTKVQTMPAMFEGYGAIVRSRSTSQFGRTHLQTILPCFVLTGFFGLGFWLWEPNDVAVPALFFLVFLILFLGYVLSGLTFFLDRFRFPLLGGLLAVSLLAPEFAATHHFFRLQPLEKQAEDLSLPDDALFKAVANRLERRKGGKVLVAVAASGGGIQAAAWTAKVLTELHMDPNFGPEFTKSTTMLSGVSGGSVGAMYFLDRLEQLRNTKDPIGQKEIAEQVVNYAAGNRLPAIAWAMAYEDSFRLLGAAFIKDPDDGRGYALEASFQKDLATGNAQMRRDWRPKAGKGDMPIPIFNATIVDTGARYLISPFAHLPGQKRAVSLVSNYPEYDMKIVTAARLSATFPYVTPQPLPIAGTDKGWFGGYEIAKPSWLVADGGFFDNYGMFTIVEWLDLVLLNRLESLGIEHVILVQINAFPKNEIDGMTAGKLTAHFTEKDPASAWSASVLGPVKVFEKVRVSTQFARNQSEIDLLKKAWPGVQIHDFDIRFQMEVTGDTAKDGETREPPLSWKLNTEQRQHIDMAWDDWTQTPEYKKLGAVWQKVRAAEAAGTD